MRFSIKIMGLSSLLVLGGCSAVPGFVSNSLGLPVRDKVVVSKQEPNELIAGDGTSCIVSRGRFEKVEVMESVSCFWSEQRRGNVL